MPYPHGHAALVDDTNTVRDVIVIPYMEDDDARITEYCNGIGLPGRWLDTSYLGARRGKYAGIGDRYDPDLDQFVSPTVEESRP